MDTRLDNILCRLITFRRRYNEELPMDDPEEFERSKDEYLRLCKRLLQKEGRILDDSGIAEYLEYILEKARAQAKEESKEIYEELLRDQKGKKKRGNRKKRKP